MPLWMRIARPVARVAGVPIGVAVTLLLRLSARKAGVALMYHSVDERAGDPVRELVPPHEAVLFERQIRHVRRHYDVVSANRLQEAVRARRRGERFPAAITFDDDLACHVTVALPILVRNTTTATFFLAGASLERPFAFFFERLQRAADEGVSDLEAIVTGAPSTGESMSIHELGRVLEAMTPDERDAAAARLVEAVGDDPPDAGIRAAQVRELAEAGMTIGFHTFRHDPLTGLNDEQLAAAMETGRRALSEAGEAPVDTIGYPHGRADERVAGAARKAGFRAGFTTRHESVTPRSDPLLLGRMGPSLRSVGALAIELSVLLLRSRSGQSTPAQAPPSS